MNRVDRIREEMAGGGGVTLFYKQREDL
jgi:hypothetical protein